MAVPLPKPARGLGRDSSAQVSSHNAHTAGKDAGKDSIKVWRGLKSSSGAKAATCV